MAEASAEVFAVANVVEDLAPQYEESAIDPQVGPLDGRDAGHMVVLADLREMKRLIRRAYQQKRRHGVTLLEV